ETHHTRLCRAEGGPEYRTRRSAAPVHDRADYQRCTPRGASGDVGTVCARRRGRPIGFLCWDPKFAGLALVNDWSASGLVVDYCMAEFFVLRKYRRIGFGKNATKSCSSSIRGPGKFASPITIDQQRRSGVQSVRRLRKTDL